ncbi:TPA: hypothetical protein KEU15_004877, partial [Serratia marcescens]|nr:hypothetical protein [Serratia marcescens]
NTAGTGLKAALKLGGVSAQSAAYAITAGAVTSATLTVDKASYVAGSPIRLTATLKDAQGNAVPAQAGALKEAVTAANAALSGNWTETDTTGTYSATYTA